MKSLWYENLNYDFTIFRTHCSSDSVNDRNKVVIVGLVQGSFSKKSKKCVYRTLGKKNMLRGTSQSIGELWGKLFFKVAFEISLSCPKLVLKFIYSERPQKLTEISKLCLMLISNKRWRFREI